MYEIFICGWLMILLIDEVVVWKFLVVESKSVLKERCLEVLFVVFDEMEVEVLYYVMFYMMVVIWWR